MASTRNQRISIVIPVYNDPPGLRQTLDSLLEKTNLRVTTKILVVDNGSTDDTADVAADYAAEHGHVTLVPETDVQSSYAARNTGLEHADGDVIVFLDADVTVTNGWLRTALEQMEKEDADYLAPSVELETPANPSLTARYNLVSGFPNEQFLKQHRYAPTACLFVRRKLLAGVGTFDDRLVSGGDLEFGNRVYEAGYDLEYAPDVTIIHPTRDSFRALFERNVRIGRGHCQLQRYYPDRYGRVGIPPRPSGIRRDQYDASMNHLLYNAIAAAMTGARGLGYCLECLRTLKNRFSSSFRSLLGRDTES